MRKTKKLLVILRQTMYRYTIMSLAIVIMVVFSLFLYTNLQAQDSIAMEYETKTLDQLQKDTTYEAAMIYHEVSDLSQIIGMVKKSHEGFFKNYQDHPVQKVDVRQHDNGAYYKADKQGSSVYYSALVPDSTYMREKIGRTEYFDAIYKRIYETYDLVEQIYFNTYDSMNRMYPYIENVCEVFGANVDVTEYNFYYLADEEHNPERGIVWTEPYLDPAGRGWIVSVIAPIYKGDMLEGVLGVDITLNSIQENFLGNSAMGNNAMLVVNDQGFVISYNEAAKTLLNIDGIGAEIDVSNNKNILLPDEHHISRMVSIDLTNTKYMHEINESSYIVTVEQVENVEWSLVVLTDYELALQPLSQRQSDTLRISLVMMGTLIAMTTILTVFYIFRINRISNNISSPISQLSDMVKGFGIYDLKAEAIKASGIQEIDSLSHEFAILAKQIKKRTDQLVSTQIEKNKAQAAIERHMIEASTDTLTQVFNRRKFDDALGHELSRARRYQSEFCLVILDVDSFKEINDQYGHAKGDDVLVGIARILMSNVRASDIVARWGGDEFVILIVESGIEDGIKVADKIRKSVLEYYKDQLKITTSIGIAHVDVEADDARTLMQKADTALYEAKRRGKNCVVAFNEIGEKNEV